MSKGSQSTLPRSGKVENASSLVSKKIEDEGDCERTSPPLGHRLDRPQMTIPSGRTAPFGMMTIPSRM
jgi:hypothetical protein